MYPRLVSNLCSFCLILLCAGIAYGHCHTLLDFSLFRLFNLFACANIQIPVAYGCYVLFRLFANASWGRTRVTFHLLVGSWCNLNRHYDLLFPFEQISYRVSCQWSRAIAGSHLVIRGKIQLLKTKVWAFSKESPVSVCPPFFPSAMLRPDC